MDFCILGLLWYGAQSAYGLRQAFAQGLSLIYADSLGAIQTTLKVLQGRGHVVCHEADGGRRKKEWSLTEAGRAWLLAQFFEPLTPSRLEESALARHYFLGILESPDRVRCLQRIVANISEALHGLEEVSRVYEALPIPPPYQQAARYRLATLDYGIGAHRYGLSWFESRLAAELADTPFGHGIHPDLDPGQGNR